MKLASQPAYNYSVVVTLTQPDNTDVTVDADPDTAGTQMSLIFTPSNWNQPQTVTVSAAEDDDAIFDRTNIRLTADGGPYSQLSQFMPVTVADDDAGLKVSSPSLTIAEGGSATFTVQLAAEPADDVTVTLAQSGTVNDDVSFDADENTDGNQTRLTFTVDNWNQDQTVTVNAAEDVDVADESVTIRLTASGGEYDAVSGSVSVNVTDDDVDLEVSPTALDVTEGASGTFTVQLASRPSDDVTVELVQSGTVNDDVTFDADGDTDGNQTRLTFTTENWGQGQTVTVSAAQDDDAVDDSATIKLTASGGGYRNITGSVEVEVEDNDTAKLVITADTDPLAVEEGKSAAFQVKLETRPSGEVTVELSRSGDTDVTLDKNSLTFTASDWNSPQTVTVRAGEDDDAVNDSATIILTAAGGDYGGVTGSVSVTVDDNDEAKLVITPAEPLKVKEEDSTPFRVKLAAQPSGNVTVQLAQPDNTDVTVDVDPDAPGNQTKLAFTADTWNADQIVTVRAAHDPDTQDDNATIGLTASGGGYVDVTAKVEVTVNDDDTPGLTLSSTKTTTLAEGGQQTFTVKLATRPQSNVTVTLAQPTNTDITADADPDRDGLQTVLTFTPEGWKTPQAVTVHAAQDDDTESDMGVVSLEASGADYGGRVAHFRVTVMDDDTALELSADKITVNEGGFKTFKVRMSARPLGEREVALVSGNLDVTLDPASLSFTPDNWETRQEVTVFAAHDEDKSNETAVVSLSGDGVISDSLTVTIIDDDDHAVGLVLSATSLEIYEGTASTFSVHLAERPGNPRTVTLSSENSDLTFEDEKLNFTPFNWSTPQTVTVTAGHDDDKVDDTAKISLDGAGITAAGVQVTIIDDDAGAPIEVERKAVKMLLAEVASGLLSSTREVVGQRFSMLRNTRAATVAGARIGLNRSIASDLAAGFAQYAGARGASSASRFEPDRFGIDRRDADWLGGIRLERGRPVQSTLNPSGGVPGAAALLSGFSYSAEPSEDGWSIWGRTGSDGFTGVNLGDTDFDGSQRHVWLGIDHSTSGGWLIGMALGSSSSDVDYTLGRFTGSLETDMTMVLPYLEVTALNGATGRVMFGLGVGEAWVLQTTERRGTADFSMQMVSASGSWPAVILKSSRLAWSGDAGLATIEPHGTQNPALKGLRVDSMRVRGGVELIHDGFGEFWIAEPQFGVLLRHDAGDGMVGTGIELTAGLQVRSVDDRFSLDVSLRRLGLHSAGELSEWGAGVQLRLSSHSDGLGLNLSLGPHWGTTEDDLLERDQAFRLDGNELQSRQSSQNQSGVEASLAYGVSILGGLFTPYSEYRLINSDYGSTRRWGNGVKFNDANRLELRLFTARQTSGQGLTQSRIRIELQKQF